MDGENPRTSRPENNIAAANGKVYAVMVSAARKIEIPNERENSGKTTEIDWPTKGPTNPPR